MIRRAFRVVAALALLVAVATVVAHAFPGLAGADYSYVVESGSMEPAIGTGSVVFVSAVAPATIEIGDVITFAESSGVPTTTHRVVGKHQATSSVRFETKGDANEAPDPEPVYGNDVVGVVTLSIPIFGYVIAFAQTQLGWLALVAIPFGLLVVSELWELYQSIEIEKGAEHDQG